MTNPVALPLRVRESGTGKLDSNAQPQVSSHTSIPEIPAMDQHECPVHEDGGLRMQAASNSGLTTQPATLRNNPEGGCQRTRRGAYL